MSPEKDDRIGWHVIARGARRLDLFRDPQDFNLFLTMLRFALRASGATLWAFTLMSNHYHMVLHATLQQLPACMMRLNRLYARYHNRRYDLVGHAFDGPYKAYRQPTPLLLLRTIAYVFMNPVAAGMRQSPEDYPWSCVRDYLGLPGSPLEVDPAEILSRIDPDPARAWKCFHRAMDQESSRIQRRVSTLVPTRTQIHSQQFEWLLDHARESAAILGEEDPVQLAIHWGKQCGIARKAMAAVLTELTPRQITKQGERMVERLKQDPMLSARLVLA